MSQKTENIVLSAWETMIEFPSLKKLNFLPSLAGMLWLLILLLYQATYAYINIFQKKDEVITALGNFLHTEYFAHVVIVLIVIFLMFTFLEPIALGGMIEMMHSYRKHHGEKNRRSWQGFFDGLGHFLPVFELHNLTSVFRPIPIITAYLFALRTFWAPFFWLITTIMGLYLLFAFFMNMCFSYANFFVIFDKKTAIQALSASTGMAVRNIGITGKLYFTSLLLYLRTLIVGVLFLLIPFLITSALAFFPAIAGLKFAFLLIFLTISFVIFIVIVHLNSTLEIFVLATWHEAYWACKEEDKVHSSGGDAKKDDHGHH